MIDTRTKLLNTATDLFLGKGFGVVGTAEICKSAAVSKGTFYHFFESKTDLLIHAIEQYANVFRSEFDTIAQSNVVPDKKLAALFDVPAQANRSWKASHGFAQGCLVGNMTLELGSVDASVRRAVCDAMASWQQAIAPVIRELIIGGQIPDIDPASGAEAVITMIQGGLIMAKSQNNPELVSLLAPSALPALSGIQRATSS